MTLIWTVLTRTPIGWGALTFAALVFLVEPPGGRWYWAAAASTIVLAGVVGLLVPVSPGQSRIAFNIVAATLTTGAGLGVVLWLRRYHPPRALLSLSALVGGVAGGAAAFLLLFAIGCIASGGAC